MFSQLHKGKQIFGRLPEINTRLPFSNAAQAGCEMTKVTSRELWFSQGALRLTNLCNLFLGKWVWPFSKMKGLFVDRFLTEDRFSKTTCGISSRRKVSSLTDLTFDRFLTVLTSWLTTFFSIFSSLQVIQLIVTLFTKLNELSNDELQRP